MRWYQKAFIGSIIAFILGTSCCWITSLAIWIGGATVLKAIASMVEISQPWLFVAGSILLILSVLFYSKLGRKDN